MSAFPLNHQNYQISLHQIAVVTGAPPSNVGLYWPLILQALQKSGRADKLTVIAAIATIAVESPSFKPVDEIGSDAYFESHYGRRRDLGNVFPGDGAKYHGRGFIQLTGRTNYRQFGLLLGIDLENHPELALEPDIAARIFAQYFTTRGVIAAIDAQDWMRVRALVNGGLSGFARFNTIVQRLLLIL